MSPQRLISLFLFGVVTLLALSACEQPDPGSADLTTTAAETADTNVGGGVDGQIQPEPETEAQPPPASESDPSPETRTPPPPAAGDSPGQLVAPTPEPESDAPTGAETMPTPPAAAEEAEPAEEENEATAVTEPDPPPASEGQPETTTGDVGAPPAEEIIHYAQAGENLFRIGLQYGYSWVVLARYNGIANPNFLTIGQPIRIPPASGSGEPPPADGNYTNYVVQPGDNLFQIGLKFGVSWALIAEANGIVNPHHLVPGHILKIPIFPGAQQL